MAKTYDDLTPEQREKDYHYHLDQAVRIMVSQKRISNAFSADMAGSLLAFITCCMRMLGQDNMRQLYEQAGGDTQSLMDKAAQEAIGPILKIVK